MFMPNIDWYTIFLLRLPTIIIAFTVHEFAHGYAALLLGDKTAKRDGRLSLNPAKHIDPIGMVFILIAGFGWAKPVMVSPYNFKNPKQDMAITAFAGPLSNFILAFISIMILFPVVVYGGGGVIASYLRDFFQMFTIINLMLGIFNLLPIPPLDGSKVYTFFLSDELYFRFTQFQYGFIVLIVLMFSGLLWGIIGPLVTMMYQGYSFVATSIYSLIL